MPGAAPGCENARPAAVIVNLVIVLAGGGRALKVAAIHTHPDIPDELSKGEWGRDRRFFESAGVLQGAPTGRAKALPVFLSGAHMQTRTEIRPDIRPLLLPSRRARKVFNVAANFQ